MPDQSDFKLRLTQNTMIILKKIIPLYDNDEKQNLYIMKSEVLLKKILNFDHELLIYFKTCLPKILSVSLSFIIFKVIIDSDLPFKKFLVLAKNQQRSSVKIDKNSIKQNFF